MIAVFILLSERIFTDWLTDWPTGLLIDQSSSCEADSFWASQKIGGILLNPKFFALLRKARQLSLP
jgi:hypothetical protein